ncbi:hypothetical protein LOD99_7237 [Oopsacas minuta]|uniref:C2CD3 N-terminal C2 domain-containing protein n=1 Tax=Oopsacas minuta TaxID=111878 RepID=A0AAV7JV16_9METZ|nr:hypothetical protein LOD99_7237 [Oopsacas minuta]
MPKISKPDKATVGRSRKVTIISPKKNTGRKSIKRKKKKTLKISGKSLTSIQTVVTGTVEPCTLPPSVQGPLRGTLVFTIGQLDWRLPINPPESLAIRLRWWGESCHKILYPPIIHEGQIIQSINTNPICRTTGKYKGVSVSNSQLYQMLL